MSDQQLPAPGSPPPPHPPGPVTPGWSNYFAVPPEGETAPVAPPADGGVAPVLTALQPAAAPVGTSVAIHVHGTGFRDGDTILWNGAKVVTVLVSPEELTTTIDSANAAEVTVEAAGGLISNALTFAITEA
jgi:hypothetical protein